MKVAGLLLAFASSSAAFAPVSRTAFSSSLHADQAEAEVAEEEEVAVPEPVAAVAAPAAVIGATAPFPGFDPLGLATYGSDETYAWFRAAELKHGRVAMLATTGYLVQAAGIHFPGMVSMKQDISFESLSAMKPFDAWVAMPEGGKIVAAGMIVLWLLGF